MVRERLGTPDLGEDSDHVIAIFRINRPTGDPRGPCGRPSVRGYHVGDPCNKGTLIPCLTRSSRTSISTLRFKQVPAFVGFTWRIRSMRPFLWNRLLPHMASERRLSSMFQNLANFREPAHLERITSTVVVGRSVPLRCNFVWLNVQLYFCRT